MDFAIVPVFALHLVCVNLASGGPLLGMILEWWEADGDQTAGRAGRWLAGWSLVALIAGAALGALLAVLLWSPDTLANVTRRIPSRLWFGVAEYVFSLVLLIGYWLWWRNGSRESLWQRIAHRSLALLATTNLIYHFPLLFGVVALIRDGREAAGDALGSAGFRELMVRGEVLSQAIHFAVASAAVAGVALMIYAWSASESAAHDDDPAKDANAADDANKSLDGLAGWGARLTLVATLLQFPIGLWVLTQVPPLAQQSVMGGKLIGTASLGLSLAATLWMLHLLSAAAQGESPRAAAPWCALLLGIVILLMTATLVRSRDAAETTTWDGIHSVPNAAVALVHGMNFATHCC